MTENNIYSLEMITKDELSKIEEAFSLDCTELEACDHAKISHKTLCKYIKVNKDFLERIKELREIPVLTARATIINSIKNNLDSATEHLECKHLKEISRIINMAMTKG